MRDGYYAVSMFQSDPEPDPKDLLAGVCADGTLVIWPGGVGHGPSLYVSRELWGHICADMARVLAEFDRVAPL